QLFSQKSACIDCGVSYPEITPQLFSFNNPQGACAECSGLGDKMYFDPDLVVPDVTLSLTDGAVAPWAQSSSNYYEQTLTSLCRHFKTNMNTPWEKLPKKLQDCILFGSKIDKITFRYSDDAKDYQATNVFEGVIPNMLRRYRETDSFHIREDMEQYKTEQICDACNGYRLKPESLSVKIGIKHIGEISMLSIETAQLWFSSLEKTLNKKDKEVAARILKEINSRLTFLLNVGLDYLSLSRMSGTLSGGESQRIRLASQIGSGLTGVLYVLDEPSIGLHQRDNNRLLETLKHLRDIGNTVLVVEHDEDSIRTADYLIDMGPGAGIHGGEIVTQGTPSQVISSGSGLTAQYLNGSRHITVPKRRRSGKAVQDKKGTRTQYIEVIGARQNNLKNVHAKIPVGTFTCVTGVSGSGKSSLIIDTLYAAAAKRLMKARTHPGLHDEVRGLEYIDKVIDIDQSPIGRTPRSNPATYTGAFTPIREWFTGLPESKARGYNVGRFSFNVKGGRCETCQGDGVIKIEMHFLPDVHVTCDACKGRRYNRETLEIKYREKNIAEILDMTVEEGVEFFRAVPAIREKLEALKEVGLGYVHIGQRATTLSGGEAQRVKLAKELARRATGRTLYILDEPTTGLHFEDVRKLLEVLHRLVDQNNTVVVIEHNLEVIKTADWIIDVGPEGGNKGGEIIIQDTPERISAEKKSYTGEYLKPLLKKDEAA
ncbi:MAG: excinuclease ABC subunit UvrA, partial [Proteobacteria bacterium]|nr:excinuclease ABC subunit UvrA [Pseudomonadota bacterium]